MANVHKYIGTFFLFVFLISSHFGVAQKTRFIDNYPLAAPGDKEADSKEEYEKTVSAMMGGVRIMALETTPTKNDDPEAFTKDDYKKVVDEMGVYATELSKKIGSNYEDQLKKISKSIKSNKFTEAMTSLENIGAKNGDDVEELYFIWKEYLQDLKHNAPWTDPRNIEVTRMYRSMLNYVSKNYERPFGAQAEMGAVIADAAQALSNCLEHPHQIAWKGDSKMNMRKEDELRRLASNVAYYNWRMHDKVSGRRAALINVTTIRHLQLALYDVIRTIMAQKDGWDNSSVHGLNLLRLFEDTKTSGWSVNGDKANKKKEEEAAAANKEG